MHTRRLLKARAGFTLAEVMVALTLTAVIGAAVTGVFVTQARFFDQQEKTSFARSVSRGAMNIITSELRMLERASGVVSASEKHVTILSPYAMGIVCGIGGGRLIVSQVPGDTMIAQGAAPSGYAYRESNGAYTYVPGTVKPINGQGQVSTCTAVRVRTIPADSGGRVIGLSPTSAAAPGAPVLLYQQITYEFKASASMPGRVALWRTLDSASPEVSEELVAPFDATAGFRFFVNDAADATTTVPSPLSNITGLQMILDGLSDRTRDGIEQRVPMITSVFFRNR